MDTLPHDILIHLMNMLDLDEYLKMIKVSKLFHELLHNNDFFKEIIIEHIFNSCNNIYAPGNMILHNKLKTSAKEIYLTKDISPKILNHQVRVLCASKYIEYMFGKYDSHPIIQILYRNQNMNGLSNISNNYQFYRWLGSDIIKSNNIVHLKNITHMLIQENDPTILSLLYDRFEIWASEQNPHDSQYHNIIHGVLEQYLENDKELSRYRTVLAAGFNR